jgi:predicted nucleic acid-binding protein
VLVFLDANITIYLIEQPPTWGALAAARIKAFRDAGDTFAVSELVGMECRVHPLAQNDHATLAQFEMFFQSSDLQVIAITRAVCDRATDIRAKHRLRPLDSLHLGSALEGGCSLFLTNDQRLGPFPDIPVEVLTE